MYSPPKHTYKHTYAHTNTYTESRKQKRTHAPTQVQRSKHRTLIGLNILGQIASFEI